MYACRRPWLVAFEGPVCCGEACAEAGGACVRACAPQPTIRRRLAACVHRFARAALLVRTDAREGVSEAGALQGERRSAVGRRGVPRPRQAFSHAHTPRHTPHITCGVSFRCRYVVSGVAEVEARGGSKAHRDGYMCGVAASAHADGPRRACGHGARAAASAGRHVRCAADPAGVGDWCDKNKKHIFIYLDPFDILNTHSRQGARFTPPR